MVLPYNTMCLHIRMNTSSKLVVLLVLLLVLREPLAAAISFPPPDVQMP